MIFHEFNGMDIIHIPVINKVVNFKNYTNGNQSEK
jgi:hypothetical protein